MRCFTHRDREALGVCQGCGKAVCDECIQAQDRFTAVCSDLCARRVGFTRGTLRVLYRNVQKSNRVAALFLLTIGAAFGAIAFLAGLAVLRTPANQPGNVVGFLVALAAAAVFVGYGLLFWSAQDATLMREADEDAESSPTDRQRKG